MNTITPPPKAKDEQPSFRVYRGLDAAYGCFALILLTLCYGPLLAVLPISQGAKEGWAMLLAIPMVLLGFVVGIVALVLAIIHRSEWQLVFMAFVGVLFVATLFLDNEDIMLAVATFYVVITASCCVNWFFFRRKKVKRAELRGPSGDQAIGSSTGV
ncbi:MAG TPA: hypothetical protein VGR76_14355 [Candidatus Angelobacter sp.]|jgi:type IV secretory pathway VirB3-like protein|nr:hypothetical protein [Candidatus Angelobacter sp.]